MENKQYVIAQEEHDYNKKYEEGTIVKHTIDGNVTTYVAKKNVPQFTSILNENYWKKIASTEEGGTVDYDNLRNKPSINGVELDGNKTSQDLGVYSKPSSGIPQSDLSSDVQSQLNKHFKGWLTSKSQLPSNPEVGDYAYVEEDGTTYIYRCSTNGEWPSTSAEEKDPVDVTFAGGEEVNETYIDDTHLVNPKSGALPTANDAMQLNQKLRGITLEETKGTFTFGDGYIDTDGSINGTISECRAIVNISQCEKLRFLGLSIHALASNTLKSFSYCFYDSNNDVIAESIGVYEHTDEQDDGADAKEYIVSVPDNASTFMCSVANPNRETFYCYLENGSTTQDMVNTIGTLDKQINGYEGYNYTETQLDWTVGPVNRGISSAGKWASLTGTRIEVAEIVPGSRIKLVNRPVGCWYTILNDITGYNGTGSVIAQFATGFTSRQWLLANSSIEIDVPNDAHTYLYLSITTNDGPSHTTVYNGNFGHVNGISDNIIIDDLETESSSNPLSANQGVVLKNMVNALSSDIFGGDTDVHVIETLNRDSGKTGTNVSFNNGYSYTIIKNKSYYYELDVPEVEGDIYMRVITKDHTALVTLLSSNSGLVSEGTPQYADAMNGSYAINIASNSYIDIKLTSDCNYAVFYNKDYSGEGSFDEYYMPSSVKYITKKVVEPKINFNNIGITYLIPDNEGQLNAVKRIRKVTDLEWTPCYEINRLSTGGGKWPFNDKFLSGKKYKGIPYARADKALYGYSANQFKIGFYISLETFMTAAYNRGTVLEIESDFDAAAHNAAFYANICAGTVSAALGISYVRTNEFDKGDISFGGYSSAPTYNDVYSVTVDNSTIKLIFMGVVSSKLCFISGEDNYDTTDFSNIPSSGTLTKVSGSGADTITYTSKTEGGYKSGFTNIGRISNGLDLSSLKLGDVVAKVEVHTAMITDVIKNKDGVITNIEISENTTQGNGNYTVVGSEFGGVARRLWWTVEDFLKTWDGYRVLRYNSIANVPYKPSPYVPMPDEHYGHANYTMAVLPYMGNNFAYVLVNGEVPSECRKLVIEEPGVYDNKVLWSKKVNNEWVAQTPLTIDYSEYDSSTHPYVYVNLPSDMGVGEYKAYVQINNSGNIYNSTECYWTVVESLTKLIDY